MNNELEFLENNLACHREYLEDLENTYSKLQRYEFNWNYLTCEDVRSDLCEWMNNAYADDYDSETDMMAAGLEFLISSQQEIIWDCENEMDNFLN